MVKKMIQGLFRKLGYEVYRIPKKVASPPATNVEADLPHDFTEPDEGKSDDFIRLRNDFRKYEVPKLHFGCGPRVLKGWINIDLVYEPPTKST